jgi:hypothetical protein
MGLVMDWAELFSTARGGVNSFFTPAGPQVDEEELIAAAKAQLKKARKDRDEK